MLALRALGVALALALPPSSSAADNPGAVSPAPAAPANVQPRAARAPSGPALVTLESAEAAAADELRALRAWNDGGGVPRRDGIVRPLARPLRLRVSGATLLGVTGQQTRDGTALSRAGDELVWTMRLDVRAAHRLRARVRDVVLPAGSTLAAYGSDGVVQGPLPMASASPEGSWSPSAAGTSLWLEWRIPRAAVERGRAYGIGIDALLELFVVDSEPAARSSADVVPYGGSCFANYACVTGIPANLDKARSAIGRMSYVEGSGSYVCTGGLLNDSDDTGFIPYFLTAHHCFDTQAAASTLEVTWDYESVDCGGSSSDGGTTYGADLLATGEDSDFTFLRLNGTPPAPRAYLGWTTQNPSGDLFRFHHPAGEVRHVTAYVVSSSASACPGSPTSRFLYTNAVFAATYGGSSGSPLLNADARVVGQLQGICGSNVDDPCDETNRTIDGRFSVTFPRIRAWLQGSGSSTSTTLVPGGTTTTTIPWSSPGRRCVKQCRRTLRDDCKAFCASLGRGGGCARRCQKSGARTYKLTGFCMAPDVSIVRAVDSCPSQGG